MTHQTATSRSDRSARPKPLIRNPLHPDVLRPRGLPVVAVAVWLTLLARPTPLSAALGLPLVAAGAALRLWAAGHLRKTRELVTCGPYAHVRHPLYLGSLLIGAGVLVSAGLDRAALGIPPGLAFFFGYYLPYKERGEAARLERRHGERFRAYRETVRSILPSLRPWSDAVGPASCGGWRLERVRDNSELGTALAVALLTAVILVDPLSD